MDKCENEAILKQNHTIAPLYIFINGKKLKSAERFFRLGEYGLRGESKPRTCGRKKSGEASANLDY